MIMHYFNRTSLFTIAFLVVSGSFSRMPAQAQAPITVQINVNNVI